MKGFVTFNTLVFDHELAEAERALAAIAEAGAPTRSSCRTSASSSWRAQIAPDLEVHGSTQMSITSADGVRLAQSSGVARVTLARELSLDEIRTIRAQTDCELEIFVHGALCVAYSGQCFSSEAWGGRSANRGQCAQACRLPYEMIVDGQLRAPGRRAIPALAGRSVRPATRCRRSCDIGISALKIEGRYKDADYVALTTRAYRQAVDDAWAGREPASIARPNCSSNRSTRAGLGRFFSAGTNHQAVVSGRAPRHRGVLMGRVVRVSDDGVVIEPREATTIAPLKPGDGVVFDAADWRSPEEHEEGGRVFQVVRGDGKLELRFGNGAIDPARIRRGDLVWRTHDPISTRSRGLTPKPDAGAQAACRRARGGPRRRSRSTPNGRSGRPSVDGRSPGAARSGAESRRSTRNYLARRNSAGWAIRPTNWPRSKLEMRGSPFVPSSLLNQLRREAVEQAAGAAGAAADVPCPRPAR